MWSIYLTEMLTQGGDIRRNKIKHTPTTKEINNKPLQINNIAQTHLQKLKNCPTCPHWNKSTYAQHISSLSQPFLLNVIQIAFLAMHIVKNQLYNQMDWMIPSPCMLWNHLVFYKTNYHTHAQSDNIQSYKPSYAYIYVHRLSYAYIHLFPHQGEVKRYHINDYNE